MPVLLESLINQPSADCYIRNEHMCQGLTCKLPLFPYNRGWETQPKFVGVYIPIIRIPVLKGGIFPSPKNATTLTMAHM